MRQRTRRAGRLIGALGGLAFAAPALAAWGDLNMTEGVTPLSREIYGLHMLIFGICVIIAVAVFGAMIYSIATFRKSKGAVPDTSMLHSTKLEIIWTAIPIAILVGMAIPAAKTLVKIEDTRNSDMTVKVTGYQWKWHYDYLDEGFGFYSNLEMEANRARQVDSGIDPTTVNHYLRDVDNPMVVPVGAKVRVLITGSDVIHAWWVPELASKKDAIPGFVNEFWFLVDTAGTYRGQCAELCGRDHGFMPIVVVAMPPAEYDMWVAGQRQLAGLPPKPAATVAAAGGSK